jgi:tRNA G46 methylase TrmB
MKAAEPKCKPLALARCPLSDLGAVHIDRRADVILEIASGSGEHVVHFAKEFPALVFQRSDPEPDTR